MDTCYELYFFEAVSDIKSSTCFLDCSQLRTRSTFFSSKRALLNSNSCLLSSSSMSLACCLCVISFSMASNQSSYSSDAIYFYEVLLVLPVPSSLMDCRLVTALRQICSLLAISATSFCVSSLFFATVLFLAVIHFGNKLIQ